MKLINNHIQPLPLDSGVILAAAGTKGSEKEVETLSDRDRRRYVKTGMVAIIEETNPQSSAVVPMSGTSTIPQPEKTEKGRAK